MYILASVELPAWANYPGLEAWKFFNLFVFVAVMIYILRRKISEALAQRRDATTGNRGASIGAAGYRQYRRGIELAGGPEAPAAYLTHNAAADTAHAVGDVDKAWGAADPAEVSS